MRYLLAFLLAALSCAALADDEPGHSKHGSAYDSGMRTRPWEMPGVGSAPMPITSKNPEVQKWFNQGNVLLHSFWFEEAERSFRWCLKLDPDCAMAYWGLARCGFNWFTISAPTFGDKDFGRYKTFLKEAVKRKDKVSDREKMYIEAWADATAPDAKGRTKIIVNRLQRIVVKYPDDVEAKALLSLYNIGEGSAYANELLIQQVLAKNSLHPGALHASIHNWDGISSEQAINACELYGKAAPGVGHALHMPGHIYSKIGMWNEAATAMDSATRIELSYMNNRLALPFETWNYPHNRNYLSYIQEQLGMANDALQGAKDMLGAPRDPELNPGLEGGIASQGHDALVRNLIKFEKWDQIITPGTVEWVDTSDFGKTDHAFADVLAYASLGRIQEAKDRLLDLKGSIATIKEPIKDAESPLPAMLDMVQNIAEGRLALAEGNELEAQRKLLNAADAEQGLRAKNNFTNDPPSQPWPVMRLLGDLYAGQGQNKLAVECYEKALVNEPNDAFSLSGLALAYNAMGDKKHAHEYANQLAYVWAQADPGLRWFDAVKKAGLIDKPLGVTLRKEHPYNPKALDALGPMNWQPFAAPKLNVLSVDGRPVSLQDYAGKNVVLVFFLGDACVHCVGQLKSLNDRAAEFDAQNTVILGVCSASPKRIRESSELGQDNITFLSDTDHENARRFASYDDFEDIELHSTILIDKAGKVRWKRTGGDPFTNIDFLLGELKRINTQ